MADDIYTASHRYARISARKARLVADIIRGEPVESALSKLRFCQRRAAPMLRKVVLSATANATQKDGLDAEELLVWRAYVDEGPTMKRWKPRAMGRAYPRLRRSCHLTVELRKIGEEAAGPAKGADAKQTASKDASADSKKADPRED